MAKAAIADDQATMPPALCQRVIIELAPVAESPRAFHRVTTRMPLIIAPAVGQYAGAPSNNRLACPDTGSIECIASPPLEYNPLLPSLSRRLLRLVYHSVVGGTTNVW